MPSNILPASHPGIQRIQDIFRQNPHWVYSWAHDRNVPAHNNLAERILPPSVIARKVSFGSQSDACAQTREVLISIVLTLRQRFHDFQNRFKNALDRLAQDSTLDPCNLLLQQDPSHPP